MFLPSTCRLRFKRLVRLCAPYLMQSAVALERQVLRRTLAITYSNSHGLHQLRTLDVNAPLPAPSTRLLPTAAFFLSAVPLRFSNGIGWYL
jgi:hypothetical protein